MSQPSKINATLDSAYGAVKENLGYYIGDKKMEESGANLRAQGNGELETAKSQQYKEGVTDKIKGTFKDVTGAVLGDNQMQAEGKADKLKGDAKKAANQ